MSKIPHKTVCPSGEAHVMKGTADGEVHVMEGAAQNLNLSFKDILLMHRTQIFIFTIYSFFQLIHFV